MSKYRAGIIGLGKIGFTYGLDKKREQPASHSIALKNHPSILVDGGFDIDRKRLLKWKKYFPESRIYGSLKEMLGDGHWDILVVAVNEENHYSVMIDVLRASPSLIILEKPVAPSLKEALLIQKECKKAKIPVQVNHERRFSRDYQYLKSLIETKQYGRIKIINAYVLTPSVALMKGSCGRSALIRDGTHLVDIIRYLTDEDILIDTSFAGGKMNGGGFTGISAIGKGKSFLCFLHFGYCIKPFVFEVEVIFEKGRVRIGNGVFEESRAIKSPYYEGFYSLIPSGKKNLFKKTGYFSGMVKNCVDFLEGRDGLLSPVEDGVEAMRIIEEIKRKMR